MKKFTGILLAVLLIFTAVSCSFFMEEKDNNSESLVSFSLSGKSSKDDTYYISEYITYGESTVQYGTWTDMAWDIWYYVTDTDADNLFTTASELATQVKVSGSDWKEYEGPFRVTKGVTVWAYCENTLTSATNHNVVDDMFKGIAHEKISKTKTYITVVPELDEKVAFKENTTGTVLIDAIKYEMSREQFDVLSSGTDLKKLQVKVTVGDKEVVTVTDITFTTDTDNEYTTATAIFTNVEIAGAKVSKGGTTPSNITLEFLGLKEDGSSTATDCSVYNIFELSTDGKQGVADIYVLNGLTTELKGITVENKTIKLGIVYINVTETDMFPDRYNTKRSDSFNIEALTADTKVKLTKKGEPYDNVSLVYAVNEDSFKDYNIGDEITLKNVGDKVYFKAKTHNTQFSKGSSDESNYYRFEVSNNKYINCNGNVNYLLSENGVVEHLPEYAFYHLFDGCKGLKKAPELPSVNLNSRCYESMFRACSNLYEAPKLPATTMSDYCYSMMFYDCSNLKTVPELPAQIMAPGCYRAMFSYCKEIVKAPELPSVSLADSCYEFMFSHCSKLADIPELPATVLASGCYNSMFSSCEALTKVTELPATTLAVNCYASMFKDCTALAEVPELLIVPGNANNCYSYMFKGCTSLLSIPAIAEQALTKNYSKAMFFGKESIIIGNTNYVSGGDYSFLFTD